MKKILILSLLVFICTASFAQGGRDIYNRYSGKKGVSAVYISPTMFSLMKSLPDVEVESKDVNIGRIIKTFEGMYLLSVENPELAASLSAEIGNMVKSGRYELLMEAKDEGETARIYIIQKDGIVSDFLMLAEEGREVSVISIVGSMPLDELSAMIAGAADN